MGPGIDAGSVALSDTARIKNLEVMQENLWKGYEVIGAEIRRLKEAINGVISRMPQQPGRAARFD
jgi:hypothetical protein